jgi:hydroxypyruvate isomerase
VHLGPSRVPAGVSRLDCLASFKANVAAAAALAGEGDVTLLIEPLNLTDMPDVLLGDVDEAARLIRESFAGRVWLMFDIYHVARNGEDVIDAFRRNRDVVRHVQFSDAPGRHEPGTGTIDFGSVLAGIEAAGYEGWFGAEYLPTQATLDTLGWMNDLGGAA